MIIAYIAHPVSGDVQGNIKKILEIVRHINLTEPETVPFVPYLADLMAMEDSNTEERMRGIKNDYELISRQFIDELRLYGDRISPGMEAEKNLAELIGIPVISKIV